MVCERWCLKNGVWQRWSVTKLCVKDGVSKMAKRNTRSEGGCCQVPRLPRETKLDVAKCHACHAKWRGHRRPIPAQARHQSQPSARSATPATQNEGRCHQMPRLPRETEVDVAKCHACATPVPRLCHACHAKRR